MRAGGETIEVTHVRITKAAGRWRVRWIRSALAPWDQAPRRTASPPASRITAAKVRVKRRAGPACQGAAKIVVVGSSTGATPNATDTIAKPVKTIVAHLAKARLGRLRRSGAGAGGYVAWNTSAIDATPNAVTIVSARVYASGSDAMRANRTMLLSRFLWKLADCNRGTRLRM